MKYALGGEVWEIVQDGVQLFITERGATKVRKFVSESHAASERVKQIGEKQKAGWKVVLGKSGVPLSAPVVTPPEVLQSPPEPRNAALEAPIAKDPNDRDALSVFADWLQTEGHPRGELIALQLQHRKVEGSKVREVKHAVETVLKKHARELLGPLARYTAKRSPFEWRNGYIHKVVLDAEEGEWPASVIEDLAAHPSGRYVEQLVLDGYTNAQLDVMLAAAVDMKLRVLRIRTEEDIDELEVVAKAPLERLDLTAYGGLSDAAEKQLTKVAPSLERLHLRLGGRSGAKKLMPLFKREDIRIDRLDIRAAGLASNALTALANGPWAAHIRWLDFALVDPGPGARDLVASFARFTKLKGVTVTKAKINPDLLVALRRLTKVTELKYDPEEKREERELKMGWYEFES